MDDFKYMARALELASMGQGYVSPNPMVGCVIAHNNKIIGEGFHRSHGGPHAEVNAIEQVRDKKLLKQSTVYVTLEPCAHHGLTPPCADLLVRKKVGRVVICNTDPNPMVSGRGIDIMKKAGIRVDLEILAPEGQLLNRRFFTYHEKRRPYILLKWAQTSDGFLARKDYSSKWISNAWSRKLVHKWRAEEDAVLVGRQTAASDDPTLSVRSWTGRNPIRLVIDPDRRLERSLHLFDGSETTICYNRSFSGTEHNTIFVKYNTHRIHEDILSDLHRRGILSVIVEGGSKTLQGFIEKGLWDEARIFTAPQLFDEGIVAPRLQRAIHTTRYDIMEDQLTIYRHDA